MVRLVSSGEGRRATLLQSLVLTLVAVAILKPDLTQLAAEMLGIGRGADVVLYLSVLMLIGVSFYFHMRCERLQRDLTDLARFDSLRDAVHIPESPQPRGLGNHVLIPKAPFDPKHPADAPLKAAQPKAPTEQQESRRGDR